MGFEILDVTKAPYLAQPDVPGGGDAIQDAIDAFIDKPGGWFAIWIPPGVYKLTKPLIIGRSNAFVRVNIIGSVTSFTDRTVALGGTVLEFHGDGTGNEKLLPMLIVQGGRACSFQGIFFWSAGNQTPRAIYTDFSFSAIYTKPKKTDWIDAGVRTNPRSPQCVVAIDPFIPAHPGGDANNRYPGYEDYYGCAKMANPLGSSQTKFTQCAFQGGYIGTALSPPGDVGGKILLANNENVVFSECTWLYNTIHYSCGQSQSRSVNCHDTRMVVSWLAVDTENTGSPPSPGQLPYFSGACNITDTRWFFNANALTQQAEISNLYTEWIGGIGKIGIGFNGSQGGMKFTSCTFTFSTAAGRQLSENEPEIPFHVMSWGFVTFEDCKFWHHDGNGITRFWNGAKHTGRLILRANHLLDGDSNNTVPVGFENIDEALVLEQTHTRNEGTAVYNTAPKENISSLPIDANQDLIVVQDSTRKSRGTANVTSTAGLKPGDLVRIAFGTPNTFVPEVLDDNQHAYAYHGVVGRLTSYVADTSITIDSLPQGFPFGVPIRLNILRWDNSEGSD